MGQCIKRQRLRLSHRTLGLEGSGPVVKSPRLIELKRYVWGHTEFWLSWGLNPSPWKSKPLLFPLPHSSQKWGDDLFSSPPTFPSLFSFLLSIQEYGILSRASMAMLKVSRSIKSLDHLKRMVLVNKNKYVTSVETWQGSVYLGSGVYPLRSSAPL